MRNQWMLSAWTMGAGLALSLNTFAIAQTPPAPKPEDKPRTVQLSRLVTKLPAGTQWLLLQRGMFCITNVTQTWAGGESEFKTSTVMDTFREEMTKAGLAPEQEASLFDPTAVSPSEFALAGIITDENIKVCSPDASPQGLNNLKGDISMSIDWQLYSRVEKVVVAKVHTSGKYSAHDPMPGGAPKLINLAFAENVRALAADPSIRTALSGHALQTGEVIRPPVQSAFLVTGRAYASVPPPEAPKSVMVIYAGNALGSGFLISSDGYALTDAHVVGDAERVRVRWSDGTEGPADVVRRSKERDVALIKVDPGQHRPLTISSETPSIGATVYAIGAPEGQRFEGTVTKGVVSASRVFEGFSYIQSDVTTGHGASGGPLVDEFGRVIGLTEGGTHAGTSSGITLFTPIKDAIAFLALDLR